MLGSQELVTLLWRLAQVLAATNFNIGNKPAYHKIVIMTVCGRRRRAQSAAAAHVFYRQMRADRKERHLYFAQAAPLLQKCSARNGLKSI